MENINLELSDGTAERLHIASKHLGITKQDFCHQAILKALTAHENRHGKILSTGDMEIKASDKVHLPPVSPIGTDEKKFNQIKH